VTTNGRHVRKRGRITPQRMAMLAGSGLFSSWCLVVLLVRPGWIWHASMAWIWAVPFLVYLGLSRKERKATANPTRKKLLVALSVVITSYLYVPGVLVRIVWRFLGRVIGFLRWTLSAICSALANESAWVDVALIPGISVSWIAALVWANSFAKAAAVSLMMLLLFTALIRILVWACHPVRPAKKAFEFLRTWAIIHVWLGKLMVSVASLSGRDDLKKQGEALVRQSQRAIHLVPTSESGFMPVLVFSWLGACAIAVFSYAVVLHVLPELGIQIHEASSSDAGSLLNAIVRSLAVFTTAPIASIQPTGGFGIAFCAVEISHAAILTILFLASFLKSMSTQGEVELTALREGQASFSREIEEMGKETMAIVERAKESLAEHQEVAHSTQMDPPSSQNLSPPLEEPDSRT